MGEAALGVRDGMDRYGRPAYFLNGRFDCKVSGLDTAGRMCVFDTYRDRKGGPPLHVHAEQDEWFFVREGAFLFQVQDETVRLGPGDTLLAPRGIPHTFSALTEGARVLVVFQPAGSMEDFFREGMLLESPTREELLAFHRKHGMDLVGPPLSTEIFKGRSGQLTPQST